MYRLWTTEYKLKHEIRVQSDKGASRRAPKEDLVHITQRGTKWPWVTDVLHLAFKAISTRSKMFRTTCYKALPSINLPSQFKSAQNFLDKISLYLKASHKVKYLLSHSWHEHSSLPPGLIEQQLSHGGSPKGIRDRMNDPPTPPEL